MSIISEAISQIIDGFKWIIDFFLSKVPAQITFLFFLLLIMLFGAFFTTVLHMTGVHCNSDKEVYKTNFFDFYSNYEIMTSADDIFNQTEYYPTSQDAVFGCFQITCTGFGNGILENESFYFYAPDDRCNSSNNTYFFSRDGGVLLNYDFGCVECDYLESVVLYGDGISHIKRNQCYGDAYAIPKEEQNWVQKTFCSSHDCVPPEGYYWESTTGKFTCINQSICGQNVTITKQKVDVLLDTANAEKLYVGIEENDYRRLIFFRCDDDNHPEFTVYGVPIFNYQIWLLLTVLYVLIILLLKLKSTTNS